MATYSGRILLQRKNEDSFWALPGGKCHIEEPTAVALEREMLEEIGTIVIVRRLLWIAESFFEHNSIRFHEIGFYFLLHIPQPPSVAASPVDRSLEYSWFPLNRLPLVKPTFLADALKADIPITTQHVTV